jgi:ribosomal protein L29
MSTSPIKFSDLKSLSDEELVHKEFSFERQIIQLRFKSQLDSAESTHGVSILRKNIARCRTAQRDRERGEGLSKDSLRNKFRKTYVYQPEAESSDQGSILDIIE